MASIPLLSRWQYNCTFFQNIQAHSVLHNIPAATMMTPCIKAHQQVVEWFAQEVNDYAYNYDKLFIHLNWRWIDLMSSPQEFSFFWFLWLEKSAGNAQMFHGFWILLGFPNKNCTKKDIVNTKYGLKEFHHTYIWNDVEKWNSIS